MSRPTFSAAGADVCHALMPIYVPNADQSEPTAMVRKLKTWRHTDLQIYRFRPQQAATPGFWVRTPAPAVYQSSVDACAAAEDDRCLPAKCAKQEACESLDFADSQGNAPLHWAVRWNPAAVLDLGYAQFSRTSDVEKNWCAKDKEGF